jgi:predicted short-subunit dehydrogenase-like oxidoreductase (DUF2520 family)
MIYSIIGTGNMAWFLAKRLTAAGHQCAGLYGRNPDAVEALAASINSDIYTKSGHVRDGDSDICFLAVSDHAIEEVAEKIHLEKTILVHTSGSVSINAIAASAKDHAVLWPVYSIAKSNLPNHRNIPCAWDASSAKAKKHLLTIAHGITDILFETKDEQRLWLHMSAVISNNFTNHLLTICEQICKEHDVPFSALSPIIEQTFESVKRGSPYKIQTGPARRGDWSTIQKHLALLDGKKEWRDVYNALSTSIEKTYNKSKEKGS